MYLRLLTWLRCPDCGGALTPLSLIPRSFVPDEEIITGLLSCPQDHWFPIVRGIPRMLPDALAKHWCEIAPHVAEPVPAALRPLMQQRDGQPTGDYDRRTQANFSHEWAHHELGGSTWGMALSDRVEWFFLEPLRLAESDLKGKIVLDAGCGNGSQSVAYSALGLEVIAVDLSSGLEHGHAFRPLYPGAHPDRVHFVQGDLQRPPLAPGSLDLIHSAGVLHHTPDTLTTFRALLPLLRPGGRFYIWVYKYERVVTPIVNALRAVTTRIPSKIFAPLARLLAVPFILFCLAVNVLGLRSYGRMSRAEAALALMDIFGAPYAYYHSEAEVTDWYRAGGFEETWPCNETRRGFGVCGRLPAATKTEVAVPATASSLEARN